MRADLERAGVEPERRNVFFFDTQDLTLVEKGVVLRARLTRGGADDSTVKLRPVVPAEIDAYWRNADGFEIELDVVGETAAT